MLDVIRGTVAVFKGGTRAIEGIVLYFLKRGRDRQTKTAFTKVLVENAFGV
jgi:hypothetical protein